MNKIPSIKDIKNLKGKRVVLRLDLNVPIKNGKIVEPMRIDRALPTLQYLVNKKAKVVILSHIGKNGESSLKPVLRYLNKTMHVGFVPDFRNPSTQAVVDGLPDGGVVLFENLRIDEREEKNDPLFAKHLASFGDLYVNDAFAVSHRAHASVVGVTKYLPSYAGFLIADEVNNLSKALEPKHPFLFVLGGAKFDTKLPLLKKFMKTADQLFIGGILANDFLQDVGFEVGGSVVDPRTKSLAPLLKKGNIILPTDVIVRNKGSKLVKHIDELVREDSIMDVGPDTIKHLVPIIQKSKLVVWNGPLGYYEEGFDKSTIALLKVIAESKATSIIGGGDTAAIVEKLGIPEKISFVSTGGGATLDYLAHGTLPGIKAIINCKKR